MSVIKNVKINGQHFYGMHMLPGTAEYREPGKDPYRIFIGEEAIKNMDPSFSGKPVYVQHVDEVDLEKTDGMVVRSFFNRADGKHWVEFLVNTDAGALAIANGWKLSNAYIPKELTSGGMCNGVDYDREVTRAEYEHLAIVPNPRYEESVILTPEQFKEYNAKKEIELERLTNSKTKGEGSMLNFFKRAKVENAADMEGVSVTLPKSKKEMTISELVSFADTIHNMNGYANGDHMVKAGDEEMSVNQLVEAYGKMKSSMAESKVEEKKENSEETEEEKKKKEEETKKNAEEAKAKEEKKMNDLAHFEALKNAPLAPADKNPSVELAHVQLQRGQDRYGSK